MEMVCKHSYSDGSWDEDANIRLSIFSAILEFSARREVLGPYPVNIFKKNK